MQFRTFAIAMPIRFRGLNCREGMLVQGEAGWGEFSPFPEYSAAECVAWLDSAVEAATQPWPATVRDRVPVNCTVPAVGAEEAARIVTESGCQTAKVKVAERGQVLFDDVARVEAVRQAIGPRGLIRIDANGAWSVDDAAVAVKTLDAAAGGLEYVEQPCPTVEDLAALRRRLDIPIAADESIRRVGDPLRVKRLEAADIAVLKVQPLGGVRACLRLAEELDMPIVVSSAVETSVGLAAGVALAAALPDLPYACGLGTHALLGGDVTNHPLQPDQGYVSVRRVDVDTDAWERVAADEDTDAHWRGRLAAVQSAGANR